MSPTKIKAGKTYRNRGAGTTRRTVIAIGTEYKPDHWWGVRPPPEEPGVLFEQNGKQRILYLSSFARWAGAEC